MNNLYFPICAVLINLLIVIVFNSKQRINTDETKIYSYLVYIGIIESTLACILVILMNIYGIPQYIYTLHRIDYILMISWIWGLFYYVTSLTFEKDITKKRIKKITITFNVIVSILFFFLKVNVINSGGIIDTNGQAMNLLFMVLSLYVVLMIVLITYSIACSRISHKKLIPIFVLAAFAVVALIIRSIAPEILIVSLAAAYADLIMYFTIENPDIKMLEEIKKANDLSEKYNNDKSKFIFNMTQQVRYPLNSIEQKIEQAMEMNGVDEIKEELESIKNDQKRISNIINGTLDVSNIDSRKIKIVESEYNLSYLLKEIIIKSEKMAESKEIEFRTNIDESIPLYLYGDSIRMKQLINSIISNSIKYTNEGFVELDVSTIKTYDICRLIISVKDSGIGLKTEEIDKLFNSNSNLEDEDVDESDIKLDVVKKLVNMIGGTITVQSEKGKGSEFTIVVDQKIVNNADKYKEILASYEQAADIKKVLFVNNDEALNNNYKKKLLGKVELEIVENGQKCLEKIRNGESFDFIIINEEQDKLGASEILIKLKEINDFNIPVYILCSDDSEKDQYINEGFTDTLDINMAQKDFIKKLTDKEVK